MEDEKTYTYSARQEGHIPPDEGSSSVPPVQPSEWNTAPVPVDTTKIRIDVHVDASSVPPVANPSHPVPPETTHGTPPDDVPSHQLEQPVPSHPPVPYLTVIESGENPNHPFLRTHMKDLPPELMEKMFMEYFDNPNLINVARKFDVPYKTLRRFAMMKDWEGRRDKILAKAEQKTDYTLERATEQSLLMVRAAKNKLAERLKDINAKHIDPDKVFSEIERVIRLEQLLLGGTESRKESVTQTHEERMRELREARIAAAKDVSPVIEDGNGRKPN